MRWYLESLLETPKKACEMQDYAGRMKELRGEQERLRLGKETSESCSVVYDHWGGAHLQGEQNAACFKEIPGVFFMSHRRRQRFVLAP